MNTLQGHSAKVNCVAFNKHNLLASGSNDRTGKIWNTDKGDLVTSLLGHSSKINCVAFNGRNLLATGSSDKTVQLWRTDTWTVEKTFFTNEVLSLSFGSGIFLAVATGDRKVQIWNTATGIVHRTILGHDKSVWAVAFNGRDELATGSIDGSVKLWNLDVRFGGVGKDLSGHSNSVESLTFSRNSVYLATGSSDKSIRIWNADTGALVKILQGHAGRVTSIAFDQHNILASRSDDGTVKLWFI